MSDTITRRECPECGWTATDPQPHYAARIEGHAEPVERTYVAVDALLSDATLKRAGNVFLWAVTTGPSHPDATVEKAAEEIIRVAIEAVSCGEVNA
jgi:hypothetical protein